MVMAQADDLTVVLDKITKLKALAHRPGTPEEAAAATAAIQRLIFRHNLTELQVDQAGRDERRSLDRHDHNLSAKRGASTQWLRRLVYEVCRTNFCIVVNIGKQRVSIVGTDYNATSAWNLYEFLETEIRRLGEVGWEAVRHNYDRPSDHAVRWKNDFYHGAVTAVAERLQRQFEESKRQNEGGSALVLVNEEELRNAVAHHFGKTRQNRADVRVSDAYARGVRAGHRINLAKQIEGAA